MRYDIKKGLHLAFQALKIKRYIGWVEFSKLCKPCENYLERNLSGSLQQNLGESAKVLWKWSSFQIFSILPWHLIITCMAQSIPSVPIWHLSFCLGKATNAPFWGRAFIQKTPGCGWQDDKCWGRIIILFVINWRLLLTKMSTRWEKIRRLSMCSFRRLPCCQVEG